MGNINRDLKTSPLTAGNDLFADGETSLTGLQETIGGGGANSAAMAAGLGAKVAFVGQVGVDWLGRRLERTLRRVGVRCFLHKNRRLRTGTTLNLVFRDDSRHFLSCHPNNEALAWEHLDLRALRGATHLLRADVWFSAPMLYGGNEKLFQQARQAGLAVSLDLNWDPRWGNALAGEIRRRKEAVRQLLPLVDLAHGNVRELGEFTGAGDLRTSLKRLIAWGAGAVVVHLGARGAGYYAGGKWIVEQAAPARRQVQTTGTGDLLSVCMMLMHDQTELPIRDKLRLANRIVAQFMEGRRQLIPAL